MLLPAAISLLSEGDIVCEPNWSFRRHLNPRLCSKSPPRTSNADFLFFLRKHLHASFYGTDMCDDNALDMLEYKGHEGALMSNTFFYYTVKYKTITKLLFTNVQNSRLYYIFFGYKQKRILCSEFTHSIQKYECLI